MEKNGTRCAVFGRVRNRIDLIGRITKMDDRFVCLKIPSFKGCLEYPSRLVEVIERE